MNWSRLYELLQGNRQLLQDPAIAGLLEDRLRQIETAQDQLEQEALRCDQFLDIADDFATPAPQDAEH